MIDEIPFPEGISLPAHENAYLFAPNSYSCAENLLGEELKERICDAAVEVVSFDVFDTLVSRPFFYPTDLFYLLEEFANEILGITDKMRFKKMSSEARITKWSGKLFKRISEDFKVKPCKILHIGDNKESDILSAQNCGLKAAFIPRTVSVLTNEAGSPFYAGECVSKVYRQSFLGRSFFLGGQ